MRCCVCGWSRYPLGYAVKETYLIHILLMDTQAEQLSFAVCCRKVRKGKQCHVNWWRAPTTICHLALFLFWCILRNQAAGLGWKKRLYCIRISRTLLMWLCRFPAYCTERHIECLQLDLNGFFGVLNARGTQGWRWLSLVGAASLRNRFSVSTRFHIWWVMFPAEPSWCL